MSGLRYARKQTVIDVFIPGARWGDDLGCIIGEICEACPPTNTNNDTNSGDSGDDCSHDFIQTGDGDPECTFDPNVIPDWYLQLLVDRFTPICGVLVPPGSGANS